MKKLLQKTEAYFAPVGRIIMGAYFLLAGISKVFDVAGTAAYIDSVGLPTAMLLAYAAIVFEIGAGAALMVGLRPKVAALLLAVFTLAITFPFHGPHLWETHQAEQIMFMKNLVIFGSLLFMAAHAGKFANYGQSEKPVSPTPTL